MVPSRGHNDISEIESARAPLLFITNPNSDSVASLRLTYRCKVIIDHSKHQLFASAITEEPLMLTFSKYWLGEVDPRPKGCCQYVKGINKFYMCMWSMFVCVGV